jgi:hypothetical protein
VKQSTRKHGRGPVRHRNAFLTSLGVVAVIASLPGAAIAQSAYNLSLVTQIGDTIDGRTLTAFRSSVSLNDNGAIAFLGLSEVGNTVFTQNSVIATGTSVVGGFQLNTIVGSQLPSISNTGQVIFAATYAEPGLGTGLPGVFTQSGPRARYYQDLPVGGKMLTVPVPQFMGINPNGGAVYRSNYENPDTTSSDGIFSDNALLVSIGDSYGGRTLTELTVDSIGFNNAGTAAFFGNLDNGAGSVREALLTQNSILLQEGTGFFEDSFISLLFPGDRPSINNSGVAVTRINYISDTAPGGNSAIVTQNGFIAKGNHQTIIGGRQILYLGSNFQPEIAASSAVINDSGTVAFLAMSDLGTNIDTRYGLFTQNDIVALAGDTVGGKTLGGQFLRFSPAINNQGAIAFIANFTDGTQGIVLATPVASAAPEPTSAALLLGILGAIAAGRRTYRPHRRRSVRSANNA